MPTNLYDAHRQWAMRPPDERFPDLNSLREFTGNRKRNSIEDVRTLRGMRLYATRSGALNLNGHLPHALLTNWSFSQLCQLVGAPAGYLRSLPADMTAQCLEYGISKSGEENKILIRRDPESGKEGLLNQVSAFTSPSYGRIWDYDIVTELIEAIDESNWHTPPSHGDGNSGLYASDRDMFVFLINDEQPIEIENARLSRGFFCWNSETGATTFGLTTFLYNHICGNHIVWGAEQIEELRIFHRNRAVTHFYEEAIPVLNRFAENRNLGDQIVNLVAKAMQESVGQSLDDTLKWFKSLPFTRTEITQAWQTGQAEGEDTMTLWGMVQGLTASAKHLPHADKRVNLERRAGALLS